MRRSWLIAFRSSNPCRRRSRGCGLSNSRSSQQIDGIVELHDRAKVSVDDRVQQTLHQEADTAHRELGGDVPAIQQSVHVERRLFCGPVISARGVMKALSSLVVSCWSVWSKLTAYMLANRCVW